MAEINRPPADITPRDFFLTWFPEEYRNQRASGAIQGTPPDLTVGVLLDGPDGGAFTLTTAGGELASTESAAQDPQILMKLTVADWRAAVVGEEGANVSLAPKNTGGIDSVLFSEASGKLLSTVTGTLRFEVLGYSDRDWKAEIVFGGTEEPSATISVTADVYKQILDGSLNPAQAYFGGMITIAGDANLAMQVAMQAMAGMGT